VHGVTFVDIIIGALLLFFAVKGFIRGFVREVSFLLGLLFGVWAAFRYYPSLARAMGQVIRLPHQVALLLSFILILLSLGLLFVLFGHLLTRLVEKYELSGNVNRAGGLFFGLLQGGFILSLLLYFMTSTALPDRVKGPFFAGKLAPTLLVCGREIVAGWDDRGMLRDQRGRQSP
jgi:membrane protein required for colicin V production